MSKTIVIKVGTNVIAKPDGFLNMPAIRSIVGQVSTLVEAGIKVVLITSGAVGAGRALVTVRGQASATEKRQVLAAVGQVELMASYSRLFQKRGLHPAQVLATKDDFQGGKHFANMRHCFRVLLANGVIPVVNENDVVSVEELMFTDNDELAGLVATMVKADELIILSSVDGIMTQNGELIRKIERHTHFKNYLTKEKSSFGRGGMFNKAAVAERLARQGIAVQIVNGGKRNIILEAVRHTAVGTLFVPHT